MGPATRTRLVGAARARPRRIWIMTPKIYALVHLQRYGFAVLSVVAALAAALLLEQFRFRDAAVPLFLFAAATSSWYGGPGPAVLAAGLSSLCFDFFFVPPLYTFYVATSDVPYIVI